MTGAKRGIRIEHLLMVIACLFWALGHPLGRIILRQIHPFQLGTVTLVTGFVGIQFYMLAAGRIREYLSVKPRDLFFSLAGGVFGFFLYQLLTFSALSRIPASMNAVLISTNVVFIALLAAAVLGERIPLQRLGGIGVAFAGVVFVTFNRGFSLSQQVTLTGCSLSLLAALSFAIYTIFGKRVLTGNDPLIVSSLGIFAGAVLLALLTASTVGFSAVRVAGTYILLLNIFLGLTMIGVAYPLWFTCLKGLPASHVSIYIYITPIFAVVLSLLILKETFSWRFGLGTALVLCGILLTTLFAGSTGGDRRKPSRSPSN